MEQLTDAMCERPGWDIWVERFEASFSVWTGDPEDAITDALAIVGRLVGGELEVVDLHR